MSTLSKSSALLRPLRIIAAALFDPKRYGLKLGCDVSASLAAHSNSSPAEQMNAAFLALLAGEEHPYFGRAERLLTNADNRQLARFYRHSATVVEQELAEQAATDADCAARLKQLAMLIAEKRLPQRAAAQAEHFWQLFFPEAVAIDSDRSAQVEALRRRRRVRIRRLATHPVRQPGEELLFSANALFTMPTEAMWRRGLTASPDIINRVAALRGEQQRYWYDHPIPIGGPPEANEVLYGLRALDDAVAFEGRRGTCLLSLSVTHTGLRPVAGDYLRQELAGQLKHIDLYAFSEADCERLRQELLLPPARHYLGADMPPDESLSVLGVDGEYGRHYSFLKAIAALWHVLIDPRRRATFKIDLDQVFPQERLRAETGASAFGHLATPLWGAVGETASGEEIELGMLAGALVNEQDFRQGDRGLFTLDVPYPDQPPRGDQFIFYSRLTQALSTEAEMGSRAGERPAVGGDCLQRIHVTGGTNGILVEHLRRQRPFTPSFIGRAEDQAYLLSTMAGGRRPLGYAHAPGLIMRHDKQAFATEAIKHSRVGTIIGDYIRILYFSAYANVIDGGSGFVKDETRPFTGGFISSIPHSVTRLRFCLQAATLTDSGQRNDFIEQGAARLMTAADFLTAPGSSLNRAVEEERRSWNCYYDLLDRLEQALQRNDSVARRACQQAAAIIADCRID